MLFDKTHHLLLTPPVYGTFQFNSLFFRKIFNQFICPETLMTFPAVHQRIGKSAQMSGSHPGLGVHQNSTVHTYIIGIFHHAFLPPCLLHVIFQFHTQITVIPGIRKASVNLRTGINKASCLGQRHDFFHGFFHTVTSFFSISFTDKSHTQETIPLRPPLPPEAVRTRYPFLSWWYIQKKHTEWFRPPSRPPSRLK